MPKIINHKNVESIFTQNPFYLIYFSIYPQDGYFLLQTVYYKDNIQMQSFQLLSKLTTSKSNARNRQIIQDNLQRIAEFLIQQDITSLKLTCKPFYYYFVTAELWVGLKINVAQQKYQYLQDLQFQQAQTKPITKKDKNIRIHSLKKQTQSRNNQQAKRQPSNIKQKSKTIKLNNQLLFRNTQVGFKRLLRKNTKKKQDNLDYQSKQISELPKVLDVKQYIIKTTDPWSANMSKAQRIVQFFKRVNEFHHSFLTQIKIPSKQFDYLTNKIKKAVHKVKIYDQFVSKQQNYTIINSVQGANQNLLIDQQLNKVCRLFWKYHISMMKISNEIHIVIQKLEQQKNKISQITSNNSKSSIEFLQSLSMLDESIQNMLSMCEANRQLSQLICGQLINIYFVTLQDLQQCQIIFQNNNEKTNLQFISWSILVKRPFFAQTVFQILASISTKLIKLANQFCPEDLTLSLVINKIKNVKFVAQSLMNIAKYFGKIRKQIQQKQKKIKDIKISEEIKKFIDNYQNAEGQNLYSTNNTAKLNKIVIQFKQRISNLKGKIQSN